MFELFLAAALAAPDAIHPKKAALDELAPRLLETHDVPSVGIAYIEDGKIAFVVHYGEQEWGVPANEETLYNVASLTKPVSAEAVLRLVDAGEFDLDTPLVDYLVDEDIAGDPRAGLVTSRLVMHHRTGFPNWRYETDGVLAFIADPDSKTGYSGEGYEWMAKAAAMAGGEGEAFDALVRRLVLDPVDMPLTSHTRTDKFFGRIAFPYKKGESVWNAVREPGDWNASDDIRTTAREYARFVIDVMEGDAIAPELRALQREVVHDTRYKPACKADDRPDFCAVRAGWALGWFVHDYGDRKIIEHSGGDHGEKTLAFYDPVRRNGAVILTNGAGGDHLLDAIGGMLDGDPRWIAYLDAPY